MVCYAGLKPHERQGMKVLAEERAREGLPLHLVVPESMRGGTAPMPRSIDTVAQAQSVSQDAGARAQSIQPVYKGREPETTGQRPPYFS